MEVFFYQFAILEKLLAIITDLNELRAERVRIFHSHPSQSSLIWFNQIRLYSEETKQDKCHLVISCVP